MIEIVLQINYNIIINIKEGIVILLKIDLPEYVLKIIDILNSNGYEAYAVGGCVRDSLLNRSPKDWDITTNADVNMIKELFDKTFDTGLKYGSVTVLMDKSPCEVTTYRIDGVYKDARRPESILPAMTIEEDLKRRDFTINALAYNPKKGLIDICGGINDLRNRLIRTCGDAKTRFNEDALRIIRAFRFACELDFNIEEKTLKEAKINAVLIDKISAERIQKELDKILIAQKPKNLKLLIKTGALNRFLPCKTDLFPDLKSLPAERNVRLYTFMLYVFKNNTEEIQKALRALKYDKRTISGAKPFISACTDELKAQGYEMRKALYSYGKKTVLCALYAKKCLFDASISKQIDIIKKIEKSRECINKKELAVKGNDLYSLGIEGEKTGKVINALMEEVLKNPAFNSKEKLLELAKNLL